MNELNRNMVEAFAANGWQLPTDVNAFMEAVKVEIKKQAVEKERQDLAQKLHCKRNSLVRRLVYPTKGEQGRAIITGWNVKQKIMYASGLVFSESLNAIVFIIESFYSEHFDIGEYCTKKPTIEKQTHGEYKVRHASRIEIKRRLFSDKEYYFHPLNDYDDNIRLLEVQFGVGYWEYGYVDTLLNDNPSPQHIKNFNDLWEKSHDNPLIYPKHKFWIDNKREEIKKRKQELEDRRIAKQWEKDRQEMLKRKNAIKLSKQRDKITNIDRAAIHLKPMRLMAAINQ